MSRSNGNPNKFRESKYPPRCNLEGCTALLSAQDIANGNKYHTDECYFAAAANSSSKLFDDPTYLLYGED